MDAQMCGVSIGLVVCKLFVTSRSTQTSDIFTQCHPRMMIAGLSIINIQIVQTLSRHEASASLGLVASGQVDTAFDPRRHDTVATPALIDGYDGHKSPLRRLDINNTETAWTRMAGCIRRLTSAVVHPTVLVLTHTEVLVPTQRVPKPMAVG